MRKLLMAISVLLFCIPLGVSAQGFMPWTDVMMEADSDGSGGISMQEVKAYKLGSRFQGFQPWMADHFAEVDLDGDGEVSMFELKKSTMNMGMTDQEVSTGFYRGFGFMPSNQ